MVHLCDFLPFQESYTTLSNMWSCVMVMKFWAYPEFGLCFLYSLRIDFRLPSKYNLVSMVFSISIYERCTRHVALKIYWTWFLARNDLIERLFLDVHLQSSYRLIACVQFVYDKITTYHLWLYHIDAKTRSLV